ncbi:MAG: hypothetical protein HY791_22730 [Deltaproteobacteria bacterium]|nr:hypothetical protein [Deltaproteobacteria bacterium]
MSRWWSSCLVLVVIGCADDPPEHSDPDAGPGDTGPSDTGGQENDASVGDASRSDGFTDAGADANGLDANGPDAGLDATTCDPLSTTSSASWARLSGRIEVNDYDFFDETFLERARVRNAGFNFRSRNFPIRPSVDAPLFSSLAEDACVVVDIPALVVDTGPPQDVGTQILIKDSAGALFVRILREAQKDGPGYDFAGPEDVRRFFDMDALTFASAWKYELPGDSSSGIRRDEALVGAVPDFEVAPAFTSTSAALRLDPAGARFTWTATAGSSMSIVLDRATDQHGSGRYLVCHVADDGEFTIPADDVVTFGSTPSVPFGLAVARGSFAPLCNDGVTGAVSHMLAYIGTAVLP